MLAKARFSTLGVEVFRVYGLGHFFFEGPFPTAGTARIPVLGGILGV